MCGCFENINALTTVLKCRFNVMCSFSTLSLSSCHVSFEITFWRKLLIKFYHFHKFKEFIVIINISLLSSILKSNKVKYLSDLKTVTKAAKY